MKLLILETTDPSSVELGQGTLASLGGTGLCTHTPLHTHNTYTGLISLGRGLNPGILSENLLNIQLVFGNPAHRIC